MLAREQAQVLSEKILSYSKFPECFVTISESENAFLRFANNGITTSGFVTQLNVNIESTRDRKTGAVSLTKTDDASLREAVARSEEMARIAPADPEHMEPLGPQKFPQLQNYDEHTAAARSPVMAPQVRAIIDAATKSKLQSAGFFTRTASASSIANKKGLFGFHQSTDSRLSTTIRRPDGSSSGWAGQPSVRISEIRGADLADRAIGKCVAWEKPRRLEPGKYTVVLEADATGDLLLRITSALSGRSSDEGRTAFSKKGGGTLMGEKLFSDLITLRTDPSDARLPALPWSDSLPNRKITWIEKGVLRNLAYSRYWAEKTGREPSPMPSALVLQGSEAGMDDLIQSVDRGLLVTHFWYIRPVNPQTLQMTGLTRDGLFLIENGKISAPVMNFRFNESPVRLLQNTRAVGRAVRMRGFEAGSMVAPALVATDFPFTSISDAV